MPPLQPFERHFFPVSKDWLSHSATEVFALTVANSNSLVPSLFLVLTAGRVYWKDY